MPLCSDAASNKLHSNSITSMQSTLITQNSINKLNYLFKNVTFTHIKDATFEPWSYKITVNYQKTLPHAFRIRSTLHTIITTLQLVNPKSDWPTLASRSLRPVSQLAHAATWRHLAGQSRSSWQRQYPGESIKAFSLCWVSNQIIGMGLTCILSGSIGLGVSGFGAGRATILKRILLKTDTCNDGRQILFVCILNSFTYFSLIVFEFSEMFIFLL
jgi:hypothetical protein